MTNTTHEDFQTLEVRPGVFFPIPKRVTGIALMRRRLFQMGSILFSKRFSPTRNFSADISERYSHPKELSFYEAIAKSGFYKEELYAVKEAQKTLPIRASALVIGSGTGRESFALENLGMTVHGIDSCQSMVNKAITLAKSSASKATFSKNDAREIHFEKYDLLYTTFSLTNHIHKREDRINFLKSLQVNLKDNGILLFGGYFRPIKFGDRFSIAHFLLRLRWFLRRKVESGTTVISHLGHHNNEAQPILFHFYQSGEEIRKELEEAGYVGKMIETPIEEFNGGLDNFWVAKAKQL